MLHPAKYSVTGSSCVPLGQLQPAKVNTSKVLTKTLFSLPATKFGTDQIWWFTIITTNVWLSICTRCALKLHECVSFCLDSTIPRDNIIFLRPLWILAWDTNNSVMETMGWHLALENSKYMTSYLGKVWERQEKLGSKLSLCSQLLLAALYLRCRFIKTTLSMCVMNRYNNQYRTPYWNNTNQIWKLKLVIGFLCSHSSESHQCGICKPNCKLETLTLSKSDK